MMRLRSRNTNIVPPANPQKGIAKRQTNNEISKGEPNAKRAALTDISQAISNVVIDSSKKAVVNEKKTGKRSDKKTALPSIEEKDASIIEIPMVDPCPNYDFDKESANDPYSVHLFAMDIFRYSKMREKQFKIEDYMKYHKGLQADNRAILCDWMVEVQETFELNHETLYLAVKLVDLYLESSDNVPRTQLQLIACAAFFLASKFDERSPPLIEDFLYVAEETFTKDDLIQMEMKLLDTVGYDMGCPLSYSCVRRYARVMREDMVTLTLARYILETSLMFYPFVGCSESLIAAAAFFLALKMKNKTHTWGPILQKYSGYTQEEVEPLMWELNHMLHVRPVRYANLQTVYSKYSHEVFFHAACVPMIPNKFPMEKPIEAPAGRGF